MTRRQIFIILGGAVAIIIVLLVFGGSGGIPTRARLVIWGVYDEPVVFQEIIDNYVKANKHITIEYHKKSFTNYEQELINAFAADTGPDIWLIHNTWLPKHKDKIKEMPSDLFSFNIYQDTFADIVDRDLLEDGKIYGAPLYIDTLALFYNKDLLNSAGITSPPKTWEDLIEDLDKLVVRNQWGGIDRAGVALGTAENINRSTDILSLLMLQNGTKMVSDDKKRAEINQSIYLGGETYYPGQDALRFYTEFSNPTKRAYTWNRQMPYSVDAFIEGKTAMMINYSHHIPTIKERAPYLNFDVSPVPQIEGREFDISYANYWAFTVSKKTKAITEAWKFLLYLANKDVAKKYLEITKRPAARKDLIEWQKDDDELGVFAKQGLTARSWYQVDSNTIETILADSIKDIVLGKSTIQQSIETAVDKINLLME